MSGIRDFVSSLVTPLSESELRLLCSTLHIKIAPSQERQDVVRRVSELLFLDRDTSLGEFKSFRTVPQLTDITCVSTRCFCFVARSQSCRERGSCDGYR